MPNYKICRFCPNKYVPIADEKICPDCKKAVLDAMKSAPFGEPIVAGTISDAMAVKMRESIEKARQEVVDVITPVVETHPEIVVEIVEASPEDLQKEKDIKALEDAVVELKKGESAEIIAPSGPKPDVPEEKPDAPS